MINQKKGLYGDSRIESKAEIRRVSSFPSHRRAKKGVERALRQGRSPAKAVIKCLTLQVPAGYEQGAIGMGRPRARPAMGDNLSRSIIKGQSQCLHNIG